MDLLQLAVDLEQIGARPEIRDGGEPTLHVETCELIFAVLAGPVLVVQPRDPGGAVVNIPSRDSDILAAIFRHAERARPALAAAA